MPLIRTGPAKQEKPQYTEEELERYEKRGAKIIVVFRSIGPVQIKGVCSEGVS